MTIHSRLPALIAIAFLGLFIWVMAQALLQNRNRHQLQDPSAGTRPERLSFNVALPPIATFNHYYGKAGKNGDSWAAYNPFIPLEDRLQEIALKNNPAPDPVQPISLPARGDKKPPPPPVLSPIAPLNLAARQLPDVIGGITQGSEPFILALHNDELEILGIGQAIGSWFLVRIEDNSAWFTPEDGGDELRVPVGMAVGSTAMNIITNKGIDPIGGMTDPEMIGPGRPLPPTQPINFRDPRVRQLLDQNPELVEQIRKNPAQVEELIREALMR